MPVAETINLQSKQVSYRPDVKIKATGDIKSSELRLLEPCVSVNYML